MVVVVLASGLWGPRSVTTPSVGAQERESPRASASPSERAGAIVDTDEGTDSGVDGKRGTSGRDSNDSLMGSIFHAPAPIIVVTIVIAVMSFYLMALVVWMAIHYRTPAAIPPELVHEVQILLEQNKFNEAYHRLVQDSRSWRGCLPAACANCHRAFPTGYGPWSWRTKTSPWKWNIGRPTWRRWARSDR